MSTPEKKSILDELRDTFQSGVQVVRESAKKEWSRFSNKQEERQIEKALKDEHAALGKMVEAHLLASVNPAEVLNKTDVKERLARMDMLRQELARVLAEREAYEAGEAAQNGEAAPAAAPAGAPKAPAKSAKKSTTSKATAGTAKGSAKTTAKTASGTTAKAATGTAKSTKPAAKKTTRAKSPAKPAAATAPTAETTGESPAAPEKE